MADEAARAPRCAGEGQATGCPDIHGGGERPGASLADHRGKMARFSGAEVEVRAHRSAGGVVRRVFGVEFVGILGADVRARCATVATLRRTTCNFGRKGGWRRGRERHDAVQRASSPRGPRGPAEGDTAGERDSRSGSTHTATHASSMRSNGPRLLPRTRDFVASGWGSGLRSG